MDRGWVSFLNCIEIVFVCVFNEIFLGRRSVAFIRFTKGSVTTQNEELRVFMMHVLWRNGELGDGNL